MSPTAAWVYRRAKTYCGDCDVVCVVVVVDPASGIAGLIGPVVVVVVRSVVVVTGGGSPPQAETMPAPQSAASVSKVREIARYCISSSPFYWGPVVDSVVVVVVVAVGGGGTIVRVVVWRSSATPWLSR
jgi:hypothetical protein